MTYAWLFLTLLCVAPQDARTVAVPVEPIRGLRQPALSPDGSRLAFSYLGDIWTCPAEGGRAARLTSTPDDEQKPCWSPDGKSIAFSSDRNKNRDIYVVALTGDRAVRRLTTHTGVDDKPDWSPDGRFIAFHSDRDKNLNLAAGTQVFDLWTIRAAGGTPWRLTHYRGENPAWAPDGKSIAYDHYSWGYGDGEHDLAILRVKDGRAEAAEVPKVVTSGREDSRKPTWKGADLYFAHEANGIASRPVMNIWRSGSGKGALIQVTGLASDRASWPTTSRGSNLIVFEHNFRLWAFDTGATNATPFPLEIVIRRSDRPEFGSARSRTIRSGALNPSWSPKGDAVLMEIEGNIWSVAPDGSEAVPVTRGTQEDSHPAWAPDGKSFVFVRAEPGRPATLMRMTDGKATPVTGRTGFYRSPAVSPDGSLIACEREVDGGSEIAFVGSDGRLRVLAKQDRVIVSSPVFAKDGALLFAATVYRSGKAESKIVSQNLRSGARRILHTAAGLIEDLAVSPSDGALAWSIRASSRENPNIQILRDENVITLPDGGSVSRFQPSWSPDGSMVLFVQSRRRDFRMARYDPRARLLIRDVEDPDATLNLQLRAKLQQTVAEVNRYIFDVVWGAYFRDYYDPFHHGVRWESIRSKYLPVVTQARTTQERGDWINRMIRELRSSHVALRAPAPAGKVLTRMLGIEYDVLEDGTLRVTAVVPNGPADAAEIKSGEIIVAVADTDLAPDKNLASLLTFPRSPAVVSDVEVAVKDQDGDIRTVRVDPIDSVRLRTVKYDNQIAAHKDQVDEASGARLLYHHIKFMVPAEVIRLRRALEDNSDRDALVLDVRDGTGGLAHKQVLHLLDDTAPERLDKNPACCIRYRNGKTQFDRYNRGGRGTRGKSWNKPVILIINEISRSDKEILAYTFRHLKIGYIVGMQTAAGVIGGSDRPLSDGSRITVSVQGWFTHDGRNLEGSGVMPDFIVPYRMRDYIAGRDPQLTRAIELLTAQLEGKIPTLKKE